MEEQLYGKLDVVKYELLGMKMPLGMRRVMPFHGVMTEMELVERIGSGNGWQKWVPVGAASGGGKPKSRGDLLMAGAARLWVPNEHSVLLADVREATKTKGGAADPLAQKTTALYHRARTVRGTPVPSTVRSLEAEARYIEDRYPKSSAKDGNPVGQYGYGVTRPIESKPPSSFFATDNRGGVISAESWQGVMAALEAEAHVAAASVKELVVVRGELLQHEREVKRLYRRP
jgi:hypothetical protein